MVFSLQQNAQIEPLARSIHTLRRQRGSAMKILVRENTASLRATDERLLLPAVQIWLSHGMPHSPLSDDDRKRARAEV